MRVSTLLSSIKHHASGDDLAHLKIACPLQDGRGGPKVIIRSGTLSFCCLFSLVERKQTTDAELCKQYTKVGLTQKRFSPAPFDKLRTWPRLAQDSGSMVLFFFCWSFFALRGEK
jgi:hypothetical protein